MSLPHLTDGNTEAQNSKGFAQSGSEMLFIGQTLTETYCVPDSVQGAGDSAANETCVVLTKLSRQWGDGPLVNIPEVIANYNHGRCFKIQM